MAKTTHPENRERITKLTKKKLGNISIQPH